MIKNTRLNVLGVEAPKENCTDKKCPFHGEITVKKEFFTGKIVKKDVSHSATLEWFRSTYIHKYERYEIKRSRIRVHNPPCLNAQVGQTVLVAKTRPLSKTKGHVILKIVKNKETVAAGSATA
ncbi:MAG TPA: 30S ribosomal protein S17 [Candidatus Nanoarchaeia archaeon]|nr:30S ribosomal protein S17 [Candidatus Nanoarchaeia archaeon]